MLDEAVAAAGATVTRRGSGPDAGCTLTALVLGERETGIAHIGDSRAYLPRGGRLARLTRDHTDVASLVEEGRLTAEEARDGGRPAVLNRALVSGGGAQPDVSRHAIRPGDRFVLLTDGVHAVLPAERLASCLLAAADPDELIARVEEAVLAAGAPDDYAIVAVDLPAAGV